MKPLTLAALLMTATAALAAQPVPTLVTVRVIARDAKAIYEAVGGAWITITDQGTGKVIASGLHTGKSSGSTQKIMLDPRKRGETTFDTAGAAVFTATIPLAAPTVVEIIAEGPAGHPQAKRSASKTLLLLPGEHITGDGVVLEIHGLIVIAHPPSEGAVEADVKMACGCPIEPDGIWDANTFKVTARAIGAKGATVATVNMSWERGKWRATLPRGTENITAVEVIAAHTATANFGMHRIDLQ